MSFWKFLNGDVRLLLFLCCRAQLEHELADFRKGFADSIRDYEVLETYDERKHSYLTFEV